MADLDPEVERAISRARKILDERIVGDIEARELIGAIQTAHFRRHGRYMNPGEIAERIPRSKEWVQSYWPLP